MIAASPRSFTNFDSAPIVAIGFGDVALALVLELGGGLNVVGFDIHQRLDAAFRDGAKPAAALLPLAVAKWIASAMQGDS